MSQKCILCNSNSVLPLEFSRTSEKRNYLQCPICGLVFVPGSFHLSLEDETARYLLHENTLSNEGYVRMFLEKIALIKQYCPGIHSVLDYGCGPEPVLAKLMERDGFDCDTYDPYFFPGYPEKKYDLVISTEVFEHFRDVRAELKRIKSLLDAGGFLAVTTLFHDTAGNFGEWWYISDPTHICFFGIRTFDWIGKEFGLKILFTDKKNFIIMKAK
jgi:SAM-dependent methyltransferase